MKQNKQLRLSTSMNAFEPTNIQHEIPQRVKEVVLRYADSGPLAHFILAARATFAKLSKNEVIQRVKDMYLGTSHLSPTQLRAVLSEAFDTGQLDVPIVPVINLRDNNETELLLLNVAQCTHRVLMGDLQIMPFLISCNRPVLCADGLLELLTTQRTVSIAGPVKLVPPGQTLSFPLDVDFTSHEEVWSGLVEVMVELDVDGEYYRTPATFLFAK